jgi:hypothetical protein
MPITPEQAREARSAAATPAAIDLSERIDTYLVSSRPTLGGEWFFDIRGIDEDVVDEAIKLYKTAGWNVRRGYVVLHDREGASLVFSE